METIQEAIKIVSTILSVALFLFGVYIGFIEKDYAKGAFIVLLSINSKA